MKDAAELDAPHWAFSLGVYMRPEVSGACVSLQDRHGLDVNVLLLALYAGLRLGARIGAEEVGQLDAEAAELRERVVEPLRAVRRHMKGADYGPAREVARTRVKAAELAAEQLEQALLAAVAARLEPAPDKAPARRIVETVLEHYAGAGMAADDQGAVAIIAAAAEAEAQAGR